MSISWTLLAIAQAVAPANASTVITAQADNPDTDRLVPAEIVIVRGKQEFPLTVPASIVRVDAAKIATLDDVATAVPGVWMVNDQDPGTNILSIRGATTDRLQQASVAIILDNVPLADTELFTPRLFDLQRVEVLKGPQGALFGKNASGGVIAINTNSPRSPGGYLGTRIGNGGLREIDGARTIELSQNWALRGAGIVSAADGWITNTTLNRKVDGTQTSAIRLGLKGILQGFDLDMRTHWLEEQGGAAWASSNNVTGKARGRLSGNVLINPIGDFEGKAWRRWVQTSARAERVFSAGQLNVLVARDSYQKRWTEELDYRPGPLTFFGFPAFPNGIQPIAQPIDVRASTLQVRWAGNLGSDFAYSIGVFGQDTDKDRIDDFGPLLFGAPPSAYATNSRQTALFGALEWQGGGALKLEAQGRVDRDVRRQTITNSANGTLISNREGTFERFQPRVAANYDFGIANLYASYGEAFRPGGFNPLPSPTSIWKAAYRPEITTSFELGAKLRPTATSAQLDVAVFSNNVTDFQNYTFIDNQSVTLNVDEVVITGFEASGSFSPIARVRIGAGYALTDTQIQRFIATDPLLGSPATRDYTGKALPNVPRDTGKIWGQWTPVVDDYEFSFRLDANFAGKTFYEIDNVLFSPARWWGDMDVSIKRSDLTLGLQVRNFTNERWAISAFGQGMTGLLAGLGPNGPFDTFTINRGRQISLSLSRSFR